MNRLELVELIEAQKEKLTPEGRGLWDTLDILTYMSGEGENTLPQQTEIASRMVYLSAHDRSVINRLTELRAGLYHSDKLEERGESGEEHRSRCVMRAAMLKDRDEGYPVDPNMILEQAIDELREGA